MASTYSARRRSCATMSRTYARCTDVCTQWPRIARPPGPTPVRIISQRPKAHEAFIGSYSMTSHASPPLTWTEMLIWRPSKRNGGRTGPCSSSGDARCPCSTIMRATASITWMGCA
eukprot:2043363-Prymnesium_polylepis.1